jgi:hypothetical protein
MVGTEYLGNIISYTGQSLNANPLSYVGYFVSRLSSLV